MLLNSLSRKLRENCLRGGIMNKNIIALVLIISPAAFSMDSVASSYSYWAINICLLITSKNTPAKNQSIEFEYNNFSSLEEKYTENLTEIPRDQTIQAIKECVFVLSPDLPQTARTGFLSVEAQEEATKALEHEIKQCEDDVFYKTTPIDLGGRRPECSFAVKHGNEILIMQARPEV